LYKKYKSYKSLRSHNKLYHINIENQINEDNIKIKNNKCNYCKRLFANNFTAKRHESKCEYKNDSILDSNNNDHNLDKILEIKNKELEIAKEKK